MFKKIDKHKYINNHELILKIIFMKNLMNRLWKDQSGQAMTEYALILAVVAVAVIAVLTLMGDKVKGAFQSVVDAF